MQSEHYQATLKKGSKMLRAGDLGVYSDPMFMPIHMTDAVVAVVLCAS